MEWPSGLWQWCISQMVYELIIEMLWKYFLALISILMIPIGHNLAQIMTAQRQPSCHDLCLIAAWSDNDLFIIHNQYHISWYHGDERSQGISNNDYDKFFQIVPVIAP